MNTIDCQDLLNRTECIEIVRNSLDLNENEEFKLLYHKVKKCSDNLVGFMGEYFSLQIVIEKDLKEIELNFFIKCVPITDPYHGDECERKGFFVKESAIYSEILVNLRKYAPVQLFPKCFYTRKDILVLEDLSASYSHVPDNEPYSMKHYQIVLRSLAQFHAASIAWETESGINIGEKFNSILTEMQFTEENEWFIAGVKGIVFLSKRDEKFQSAAAQDFINHKLYKYICEARVNIEPSKELRNVLCHRDSWNRNIMFQFDRNHQPINCQFVDFQLARYSPLGLDVLWFLYTTCTVEQRTEIFNECLNFYYKYLEESLDALDLSKELISREDFLTDIERSKLPILIVWCISEPLMKMPEGVANEMRSEDPEKFDNYMNSERNEMFLQIMDQYPEYTKTIMRPIEELLDLIFTIENVAK